MTQEVRIVRKTMLAGIRLLWTKWTIRFVDMRVFFISIYTCRYYFKIKVIKSVYYGKNFLRSIPNFSLVSC